VRHGGGQPSLSSVEQESMEPIGPADGQSKCMLVIWKAGLSGRQQQMTTLVGWLAGW